MEFYLQFGHGMMEHCRHLISEWGGGTAILSPRDLTREQMEALSGHIAERGGECLIDPQFYNPRGDHHRLVEHDYWPSDFNTSVFMSGPPLNHLLGSLLELNDATNASSVILPGLFCNRVEEDWLAVQSAIVDEASRLVNDKRKFATVCLSGEALRFEEQIEVLLNASEDWDVDGYYVVPEHPNGAYLADDPMWMTNLLLLCSGFKLQGRNVVVGYSGHQMLCLACAQVDAIAAGTWLNVRSFNVDKFQEPDGDSVSRRAKWYYCPQSLSEYKIPFLDMGFRNGVLDDLRTPVDHGSHYADVLFAGAQPSTTNYSEQQSFRHYLTCLHHQCGIAGKPTFQETLSSQRTLLDEAERYVGIAHSGGVRGQDRDFANILDVNRAAIESFAGTRGFVLERSWG